MKKKNLISFAYFKIIGSEFVYKGGGIRGDHMFKETSQGIKFGETGILLKLVNNKPKLFVPEGKTAKLKLIKKQGVLDVQIYE